MCAGAVPLLTEDDVCDDEGEDEDSEEGQGEDKQVEKAIIPPPDAVPHPRTVMVEALCGKKNIRKSDLMFNLKLESSSTASSFSNLAKAVTHRETRTDPHSCRTGCSAMLGAAWRSCRWSSISAWPPARWWEPLGSEEAAWSILQSLKARSRWVMWRPRTERQPVTFRPDLSDSEQNYFYFLFQ